MSRQIHVGSVPVGGRADIAIQSMCNTRTEDVAATVAQILRLEEAGCDIIRVAVPDMAAAQAVGRIRRAIHIPLVADIHFDYRLALECVRQGIDKIRINPGNIGSQEKVRAVADACRSEGIPIRIGVNGGSLERELLQKSQRHPGGAGGECHGPCPPAERLQFRRHLHLREVLPCAGEHGGLSAAAPADGLPPAFRGHGGGHAPDGSAEIRHRHRRPAVSGHRRHHSGEPQRRPGGGGVCGQGYPLCRRTAADRAEPHLCPPAATKYDTVPPHRR